MSQLNPEISLALSTLLRGCEGIESVMNIHTEGNRFSLALEDLQRLALELNFPIAIVGGLGIKLVETPSAPGKSYIGADLAENADRLTIRSIPVGTPAYDQGLNTGDQIVAIDGYRASQTLLQNYIGERKPGDKIKLTIFRLDALKEITFTLGANTRKDYAFNPIAEPTAEQTKLLTQYLNVDPK